MRVSGTSKAGAVVRATQQLPAARAEAAPAATSSPALPTAPKLAADVGILMALAAVEGVPEPRQRAMARARRGLDALDALHRARLGGEDAAAVMDQLAAWLEGEAMSDRQLAPLMRDIETRVRVEIARHERSRSD